ncbi:ADP-ribose pyrophosphatase [Alteribacillus persepolensis]|uniref:ADP-ribose pyrophosphatase n=1 Tax=Alteribacillus persepolensis TaxID=568899 RepID=A0A1G7ZP96_9BACI|nr:NUDIX hydrolase [Alteribacillus persepolensis]SDH10592.1 ADP-ribose pyrophosphatase [Alteribacillus persepolensis]
MDFTEKTINKQSLYQGKIIDVNLHDVTLPNGKTSKREIVNHPGAVALICVTEEKKLVMVRQYRKALEKEIVEIPAGKLEKGEDPEDTAKRELEEETGYQTDYLKKVASFYTSPGFADELVHLFETGTLTEGKAATDEDEFVEVIEATIEEAEKMIETEEIHDAKTMFAVQYIKQKLSSTR